MDLNELIEQGKVKRIFRAKRKITQPNLISHITQRAAGKEPLFIENSDYLFMLSNLKDISKRRALDVYAFCFMPNHIHLLISPRKGELHEPMRDLFSRYAMWFNKKYERKGHLFAGPYRQAVCLDDSYLLAASLYIHMNPVRAGLVNEPSEYRWSSVNLYWDENTLTSFVSPGLVLGLLSNEINTQKQCYKELLEKSLSLLHSDVMEYNNAVQKFKNALSMAFPSMFSRVEKGRRVAQQTGIDLLDDEELDRQINVFNKGNPRRSLETKKARCFFIQQLIARGYKRDEIATRLGVSVKTVYNILNTEI